MLIQLFASEEDDTDLSDNFIVKTCQRFIPVTCNIPGLFLLVPASCLCLLPSNFILTGLSVVRRQVFQCLYCLVCFHS